MEDSKKVTENKIGVVAQGGQVIIHNLTLSTGEEHDTTPEGTESVDVDALVQEIRSKLYDFVKFNCGKMRLLNQQIYSNPK